MRPRLQPVLLANDPRKATTPLLPGIIRADILDSLRIDKMLVIAGIIYHHQLCNKKNLARGQEMGGLHTQQRRQLQQLPHRRDHALLTHVLVPDDRLGDTLRLLARRNSPDPAPVPRLPGRMLHARLQDLQREKPAVELKAQARLAEVLLCGAEVMQQTGEEVGLVCEGPVGESVAFDGQAVVVDAEGVVVGFFREVGAGVGVYAFCEGRGGDGGLGGWDEGGVWGGVAVEEGGAGGGDGG